MAGATAGRGTPCIACGIETKGRERYRVEIFTAEERPEEGHLLGWLCREHGRVSKKAWAWTRGGVDAQVKAAGGKPRGGSGSN